MRFAVYDLEWHPETLEVACVGVYDGKDFRIYRTVAEFLDSELVPERSGITYFAHAGGTYDVQFVLAEFGKMKPGSFEIEASFSGSAAVIVTAARSKDERFRFCDSFFLLRDSLANIGKALGVAKGDRDGAMDLIREGRHHTTEGWRQLAEYNELDNKILYHAIDRFQAEVNEMGGELRATLASCAMNLFVRRYLSRNIKTSPRLNERVKKAYIASRVEVHGRRPPPGTKYYDVNSSFPFSMTKPQPGNLISWGPKLPKGEGKLYIADMTIKVPEMLVPPVAWRARDERIFFPTGVWRGQFDVADVEALEEAGATIERVHSAMVFEPFDDLAAYVFDLYEKKRLASIAAERGDPDAKFRRLIYKLFLNSLYGKFAERMQKRKILVHPASTRCPHDPCHANDGCIRNILPGVWEMDEEVEVKHAHMPISIHVTALSRALLWRHLYACSRLFYCDTDSVVCNDPLPIDPDENLGTLKLEYEIEEADFLAPKLYAMKKKDGTKVVRSKGFSRLSWEDFQALSEGREIYFRRMARMRENLRDGLLGVRMLDLHKAIRGSFPKRADDGAGGTRPYDVRELEERYKPKRVAA